MVSKLQELKLRRREDFTLQDKLITGTGSFFGSETKYNTAFIGEKLAKELNIIRYSLTQEAFQNLGQKAFLQQ